MSARRSLRIGGERLSNKNDEVVAFGHRLGLLNLRADREAKVADVETRLTFFEILPEIRLNIYRLAHDTEKPRDLRRMKAPVFAQISKQVRAEALPVFFSECRFTIRLETNGRDTAELDRLVVQGVLSIDHVPTTRLRAEPEEFRRLESRYCGLLSSARYQISMLNSGWLSRLASNDGLTASFRRLDLTMSQEGARDWRHQRTAREVKYADIKARVTFFDLFPELHLRIYHYAIGLEHGRELEKLNGPTLAMVSKQVRAKVLPAFFSECTSERVVWSNREDAEGLDRLSGLGELPKLPVPNSSKELWVKPRSTCARRDYGIREAFGNGFREIPANVRAWLTNTMTMGAIGPTFRSLDMMVLGVHPPLPG
ncbi:hypothetical protein LTR86_004601 [Recurvomyces mirabilis]|nr:hypothetical protein LTR86_004601 [Recurvomyces mirabilis]